MAQNQKIKNLSQRIKDPRSKNPLTQYELNRTICRPKKLNSAQNRTTLPKYRIFQSPRETTPHFNGDIPTTTRSRRATEPISETRDIWPQHISKLTKTFTSPPPPFFRLKLRPVGTGLGRMMDLCVPYGGRPYHKRNVHNSQENISIMGT